jgi:pyruvoyl-dependent arginine decarboxylase (PvlArgDC)
MDGREGETIGAGVAWAWESGMKYGLVAEAHGCKDRKAIKKTLKLKIREMANVRGIEIGEPNYRMETSIVPKDNYGCVIAALVYSS